MNSEAKRIYRSKKESVLGGVCGGIAEYFEIDPVIVRLLAVVSIFFSGTGLVFYIIAWIIIPENPAHAAERAEKRVSEEAARQESVQPEKNKALPFALGVVLIIFGALVAADELGIAHSMNFAFNIFPWRLFWPLVFIFFGVYLLSSRTSISEKARDVRNWAERRRLSKSSQDKQLFGVCGGIARHLNIDPTIIRLIFAVGAFVSFGFGLFLYIILALILPNDLQAQEREREATAEPVDKQDSSN